ncbi:MAG: S1-like domain-containing RNA-binding protein [Bacteroidota bacterium]|nr:S1-like domain-containing RNA-binding protein [Bacteroidota bacterium]
MVYVGQHAVLKVLRSADHGLYLEGDEETDILLPRQYVDENTRIGDYVNVFIYRDSEDRLVATSLEPEATVGEVAYLPVKAVNQAGAFLDWGLPKDLFVPFREQKMRMEEGKKYAVFLYVDHTTDRIAASSHLDKLIKNEELEVKEGDEVNIMIAEKTNLGFKVVVDNKHWGILYRNELFRPVALGGKMTAYVKKVREDNKLDISLQQQGFDEVEVAAKKILEELRLQKGYLPLHDKSEPEEITQLLRMSKKLFKKAVGTLYKSQRISMEQDGIRLLEEE